MISALTLRNFKRFKSLRLRLAPLTVLTGLNSAGKSTALQALLLSELARANASIPLNGPYGLALGEALDVLHSGAEEARLGIDVELDGTETSIGFVVPDDRALVLNRETMPNSLDEVVHTYLSAERLGPRDMLGVSTSDVQDLRVGVQGEFTAHVLATYGRHPVRDRVRHPDRETYESLTLLPQVEAWMQEIVGPIRIQATWVTGANAAMLRFRQPDATTDWMRPTNVGFGITYVLPIVVAVLSAGEGGALLIDSPESHLHPRAQSALGRLLARAAGAGVQIVVETHSDHIVNGVRRAIAEDESISSPDLVIHYFDLDGPPRQIVPTASGALSEWPPGFFDQFEHDLAALSRARTR